MTNELGLEKIVSSAVRNARKGRNGGNKSFGGVLSPSRATIGIGLLAALVFPKMVGAETKDARTGVLTELQTYAISAESSKAYRDAHPSDLFTGLDYHELVRASELIDAYAGRELDIESLYLLVRGPGSLSLDSKEFHNTSSVDFGTEGILLPTSKYGTAFPKAITQFIQTHYSEYDVETRQRIVDAAKTEAGLIGPGYATLAPESAFINLHHKMLLAMEEARMGIYSPQPVQASVAPQPAQQKVVITAPQPAPAPVQTPVPVPAPGVIVVEQIAPAPVPVVEQFVQPAPVPVPAPGVIAIKQITPAAPVVAVVEQPVQPAQVQPAPVVSVAPVDPCADAQYNPALASIGAAAHKAIQGGENCVGILASADAKYDSLGKQCPDRAAQLDKARHSIEQAIAKCFVDEANHVGVNKFDLGAGTMASDLVSPNSAFGHLLFGFGNSSKATSPLSGSLYLDGGNYQTDMTQRPFGGAIFNLGGKAYRLRFSFAGEGLNESSMFATGPTTVGPITSPIEGGTETRTETTSESGSSSSDGWQLANWLATAEGQFYIGNFTLDLGVGFGRQSLIQKDKSHVETSADIQQHSDIDGMPGGTVDIATGTDVTTDVDVLTKVLTNMVLGRAGLDWHGKHWTFGGDASFQLSMTDTKGGTNVGNSVTVHDTVTDINLPGFPPEQEITPGSTAVGDPSYTPHDIAGTTQWRTAVKLHVFYDSKTMSLKLAAGPVLGGIDDKFRLTSMPVAGYASALFQPTDNITAGANASIFGDEFNLEGLFATTGDFQKFRNYVAVVNELNTSGLVNDQLRQRYLSNLFDNLVETSDGFVVSVGMRVDSKAKISGHGAAAYNKHFSNGLGIGVDVGADSEDLSLEAGIHFDVLPGSNQLVLRPEFFTQEDEISGERVYGGKLSLGGYF